jgi:hypothetical protein
MVAALAAAPNAAAARRIWLAAEAKSALGQLMPDDSAFAAAVSRQAADPVDRVQPVSAPLGTAGDLTGSGRQDVLDFNAVFTRDAIRFGITARDGRTGRELWGRKVGTADDLVVPLALSSLAPGLGRVLLVGDFSSSTSSAGHSTFGVTIEAWSGKTGKTLWSSTPVTGTEVTAGKVTTETAVPEFATVLNALPGQPLDALIPTATGTFRSRDPGEGPGSASAVLVAGSDGTTSTPYPTLSSTVDPPTFQSAPDLSGDGLSDVVAIVPGMPGAITAMRADTGATIWSDTRTVNEFDQITSAGRLGAGPTADLVIEGQRVTLLDGADGTALWSRRGFGDTAARLGAVHHGHVRAVALVSSFGMGSESSNGKGHVSAVVDIRAVTAANRVVWHTRVAATIGTNFNTSDVEEFSSVRAVGDVQPDGTVDFGVRVNVRSRHTTIRKAGIVSGRNGVFRMHPIGHRVAGGLVRGSAGTDFARVAASTRGIVLSGLDGATGAQVVQAAVQTPGRVRHPFVAGLRATGHGCSDVEVGGIYRPRREVVEVVSASGARLWALRFGRRQLVGGHLVRYKTPKHFCAK